MKRLVAGGCPTHLCGAGNVSAKFSAVFNLFSSLDRGFRQSVQSALRIFTMKDIINNRPQEEVGDREKCQERRHLRREMSDSATDSGACLIGLKQVNQSEMRFLTPSSTRGGFAE